MTDTYTELMAALEAILKIDSQYGCVPPEFREGVISNIRDTYRVHKDTEVLVLEQVDDNDPDSYLTLTTLHTYKINGRCYRLPDGGDE